MYYVLSNPDCRVHGDGKCMHTCCCTRADWQRGWNRKMQPEHSSHWHSSHNTTPLSHASSHSSFCWDSGSETIDEKQHASRNCSKQGGRKTQDLRPARRSSNHQACTRIRQWRCEKRPIIRLYFIDCAHFCLTSFEVVVGELGRPIGICGGTSEANVDFMDFSSCTTACAIEVLITIGRPRSEVHSTIAGTTRALSFDDCRKRRTTCRSWKANTLVVALLCDSNGWRKLGKSSNAEEENDELTGVDHDILFNNSEVVGRCSDLWLFLAFCEK